MRSEDVRGPRLGHLNLRVSDLARAIEFYCRLGFRIVRRAPGAPIAFLGLEHPGAFQLGLSVAERPSGSADGEQPGLDHFALAYPSPTALAAVCKAMLDNEAELVAAHESGVSKSVYFKDPDGNTFELYYEYPPEQWPPKHERFRLRPLDLDAFLAMSDVEA